LIGAYYVPTCSKFVATKKNCFFLFGFGIWDGTKSGSGKKKNPGSGMEQNPDPGYKKIAGSATLIADIIFDYAPVHERNSGGVITA
jgi:hypothetical protein